MVIFVLSNSITMKKVIKSVYTFFVPVVATIFAFLCGITSAKDGFNFLMDKINLQSIQIPASFNLWDSFLILVLLYFYFKMQSLKHNIKILTEVSNEQSKLINEIDTYYATKMELELLKPKVESKIDIDFLDFSLEPYKYPSHRSSNKSKEIVTTKVYETKNNFLWYIQFGLVMFKPSVLERSRYIIKKEDN